MSDSISSLSVTYSRRFKVRTPYFISKPNEDLSLIITIPSYKEPDIVITLESLAICIPPSGTVEVIIGINASEAATEEAMAINEQTAVQIEKWKASAPDFLKILLIRESKLPQKLAGAGYARKIIMDEALNRWALLDKDGPIVCLDADCTVSENYLTALENVFSKPEIRLAHLHFEHPYQSELDETLRAGIINYELHLRCYILGLTLANYPYANHTVGSCMAVRASAYAKGGGMNSRKAGEDFHFLHKLAPLGGWFDIHSAIVYPSCRVSDRVPFGTGKAQLDYKKTLSKDTYSPDIYTVIAELFKVIDQWHDEVNLANLPRQVRAFLIQEHVEDRIVKMKAQSATIDSFLKRWWQWMDGLMVLKMVHYLRDHGYPNVPVVEASQALLRQAGFQFNDQPAQLLAQLRMLDRHDD